MPAMAQQPNIELDPADRPRTVPSPGAARRWSPNDRPGVISTPAEMPSGDGFGTPGPDAGFAKTLISRADIDGRSPELDAVLSAIMVARASSLGRAPTTTDLEAAKAMCGIGRGDAPDWVHERRRQWMHAIAHDKPQGRTAVSEVDRDLLIRKPDEIRSALKQMKHSSGEPLFEFLDGGDEHCLPVVGARLNPAIKLLYDDVDLQHALSIR